MGVGRVVERLELLGRVRARVERPDDHCCAAAAATVLRR